MRGKNVLEENFLKKIDEFLKCLARRVTVVETEELMIMLKLHWKKKVRGDLSLNIFTDIVPPCCYLLFLEYCGSCGNR